MYRIRDRQFTCPKYLWGGHVFKTKREACEALISYHSIDLDMDEERKLLDNGEIDKCLNLICEWDWELEDVEEGVTHE